MSWRYYTIRAHYGHKVSDACGFYAPDLMEAFILARIKWPGAVAWEAL
jgi:hypothetical protein